MKFKIINLRSYTSRYRAITHIITSLKIRLTAAISLADLNITIHTSEGSCIQYDDQHCINHHLIFTLTPHLITVFPGHRIIILLTLLDVGR